MKMNFPLFNFFYKLEKKQKIVLIILSAILLFDIVFAVVKFSSKQYSPSEFVVENSEEKPSRVYGLNSNAKKGKITKTGYAFYEFTEKQKEVLYDLYENEKSLSIILRIGVKGAGKKLELKKSVENTFSWGYLYSSDFDKKGKLNNDISQRVLFTSNLSSILDNKTVYFDSGFAIEKNLTKEELPVGFFVYSAYPIEIYDVFLQKAKVGYDYSNTIPFVGMAPNGGKFNFYDKVFDFSGASMVFSSQNSTYSVLPFIDVGCLYAEDYGTPSKQLFVKLNVAGEALTIYRTKDVVDYIIQCSTLKNPFGLYEFTQKADLVTKLLMFENSKDLIPESASKVIKPLKTDPGLVLGNKMSKWRTPEYELYEWNRFEGVLFFDTKDYKVQRDFFRRLAFFVEKAGYRGRILSDEELGDMHGYNAHDYSAKSLAEFFTKTKQVNVKLTEKEHLLEEILVHNGVIVPDGNGYKEGRGAVISISQESQEWLRYSFIAHESWHGIFFLDEDFRNTTAAIYYTIDQKSLDFIVGFWNSQPNLNYDPSDLYLMHNEFMAYIMQQPLSRVASYFVHLSNRGSVFTAMPELSEYIRNSKGITFEDAAKVFDSYAFDRWGLACGRVSLISR